MTDEQIKHMVNRFLGWWLPENFNPDGGITFKAEYNAARGKPPARYQPSGTNVFDATQAEAMVRYMVEGMQCDLTRNSEKSQSGYPNIYICLLHKYHGRVLCLKCNSQKAGKSLYGGKVRLACGCIDICTNQRDH